MTRIIEVEEYNPLWPIDFYIEAEKLRNVLGANCITIHHIGSTAVPGLAAKPVIDIIPVVKHIHQIDDAKLIALGYTPRGELGMPFRRFYQKGEPRTHHLHVWEEGNPEIQKHLSFRDFLIANSDYAARYAALKRNLAQDFRTDRKSYTESKDDLIKEIVQHSGFDGMTVVQVNLPNEWAAYRKLQNIQEPVISDLNVYFVLQQGVNIIAAAHVVRKPQMHIVSVHSESQEKSGQIIAYMRKILERWIEQETKMNLS